MSETEETTEVVSLFLDKTEGITPQHLAVQFGYFSRAQAWALILIPALFFALGQAIGPVIGRSRDSPRQRRWRARAPGPWTACPDRARPASSCRAGRSRRSCPARPRATRWSGSAAPTWSSTSSSPRSDRQTLVYRGRRLVPKTRPIFGWVSTVDHWEVERHEVKIELERDVVRDVQAQTRYYRLSPQELRVSPPPRAHTARWYRS